jgi:hypothetical protein
LILRAVRRFGRSHRSVQGLGGNGAVQIERDVDS